MTTFLSSLTGVLEILILISTGYLLARIGWFDARSSRLIAKVVTQIALPAYMVVTITQRFTAAQLKALLPTLVFPFLSMGLLFLIAVVVARVVRVPKSRRGLFESMFFNSNTVFIGLPVNMALFGPKSLPYVLVYYMANTTVFWTLGVLLIQRDGAHQAGLNWRQSLAKIFSPPLVGFLLGVCLVLGQITLPAFFMKDLTYVGNLTIPGSMFFIGIAMYQAGWQNMRLTKELGAIMTGRFLLAPLTMALLVLWAPLPTLLKQVFVLQSAMPVMTNAPVVAKLYGADANGAAVAVSTTTILAMVVIPVVMMIVQGF